MCKPNLKNWVVTIFGEQKIEAASRNRNLVVAPLATEISAKFKFRNNRPMHCSREINYIRREYWWGHPPCEISCDAKKIGQIWRWKLTAEIFLCGRGFAGGATLSAYRLIYLLLFSKRIQVFYPS